MEFNAYTMLFDFGYMSILLLVSTILRAKIKIFQKMFMPAALIAGLLGLVLGPQVLNIVPWSPKASSYTFMMIIIMFASLKLGHSKEKTKISSVLKQSLDSTTLSASSGLFQFGLAIVVGGIVLTPMLSELHPEMGYIFASLMPAGFLGGHGFAITIGQGFEQLGVMDNAITIATTFATFGLILAILIGMICINIGVRKGWTRFVPSVDFDRIPKQMRTGLVPDEEKTVLGYERTNPMSIDPLAFPLVAVLIVAALSQLTVDTLGPYIKPFTLPTVAVAMIYSALAQFSLNKIGVGEHVDKKTVIRISSGAADFMVGFGIATLNLTVVVAYATPLIIMSVFGIAIVLFQTMFIGRKLFNSYWFERSIFMLGWSFGVVSMGVTLLRVVDPEFKSDTLSDYGTAYIIVGIIDTIKLVLLPTLIATGNGLIFGSALIVLAILSWVICWKTFGWQSAPGNVPRPGEAAIAEKFANAENTKAN